MNNVIDDLHRKGLKATAQRVAIYEVLAEKGHASAEEIFEVLSNKMPMLSLATVYATLRLFSEKGLVEEMSIYNDKAYFDIRKPFHHHFVCQNCGAISDVDIPFCNTLKNMAVEQGKILRFSGVFYGICNDCMEKLNNKGRDD